MADSTAKPRAITPRVALPKVVPGQFQRDAKKVAAPAGAAPSPAVSAPVTGSAATAGAAGSEQQVKSKGASASAQAHAHAHAHAQAKSDAATTPSNGGVDNGATVTNGAFTPAAAPESGWASLVGVRLSITNNLSRTFTGELYSHDKEVLVLETGPQDYHLIPLAKIMKYEIVPSAASKETKSLEDVREKEREKARQARLRDERLVKPAGVSNGGHQLFLALDKTLPVRWHNKSIIVLDNVLIEPPYDVEDCKAPAKHAKQLERVKELVRLERKKLPKDTSLGRRGG